MDLLESGSPQRRVRRVPAALLVTALLVVGAGDVTARSQEQDRLLAAVVAGQASARYAERRVAATAEYAGPALTASTVPDAVRDDLRALVRAEAVARVPALERARDRAAAVPVAPWHRDLRAARASYVASLSALTEHLRGVEDDLTRLYARPPELARASAAAAAALGQALPPSSDAALARAFGQSRPS